MKKVLVISGHPDLENSTANKTIIKSLTKKMPEITTKLLLLSVCKLKAFSIFSPPIRLSKMKGKL